MTTRHTAKTIAQDIEASIRSGEFPAGHRLPPSSELAVRYGVTKNTVGKAVQQLKDTGLLEGPARGSTRVSKPNAHAVVLIPGRQDRCPAIHPNDSETIADSRRLLEEILLPATWVSYGETIAQAIETSVRSGEFSAGHRPSELAARYGAHRNTMGKAVQQLKETGLPEGPAATSGQQEHHPVVHPSDPKTIADRRRLLEEILLPAPRINHGELAGLLAVSSLPAEALAVICADLNAEKLPPASSTVTLLLNTAGEPGLLALYQLTHASPEI